RELGVARAVELLVELPRLLNRGRVQVRDLFINRRAIADVALRIRIHVTSELGGRDRLRLAAGLFDLREARLLQRVELRRGKRWLPQYLGHQSQRLRQVVAERLDLQDRLRGVAAGVCPRLQPVELLANLLPGMSARTAHEHGAREACVRRASEQALLVA